MRLLIGTVLGLAVTAAFCGSVSAQDAAAKNQAPPPEPDKIDDARDLVNALAHPDPNIRQAAAAAIQGLSDEPLMAAVGALVGVIERGEQPYAVVAGSALIEFDLSTPAREPVKNALTASLYRLMERDSVSPQRWAIAAQLIRRFAPETASEHAELWAEALSTPDPFRAYEAISLIELATSREAAQDRQTAMDRIDARPKSERTKADAELRKALQAANERRQTLLDARPVLEPALLNLLHRHAIAFTEIELDASVIPVGMTGYIRRYPDENRLLVVRVLADLETDSALLVPPLLNSLRTANQYVALEAATLIGELPGDDADVQSAKLQAVETLARLAVLPGGRVRGPAAGGIGALGDAAVTILPRLIVMLGDADPDVRTGAAESLGELGTAAVTAVPALRHAIRREELVSQENTAVMEKALEAIEPKEESDED